MDENKTSDKEQFSGNDCDFDCSTVALDSEASTGLPVEPVDRIIDPLKQFLKIESASGIMLLGATILALLAVNLSNNDAYVRFWETVAGFRIGPFVLEMSLENWVNDGLMTVFFLVVGLEIKRELISGELDTFQKAALPVAAAIGGMIVPAAIYLLFQHGASAANGWGIPMATDIAFVMGVLAVLKNRIPPGLRAMMLSLAIADDIGAILIVAIGYTEQLHYAALFISLAGIALLFFLFRVGVRNVMVFMACMFFVWVALEQSGIHPVIAGVVFGFLTPTRSWVREGRLWAIARRTLCLLRGEKWRNTEQRYEALRQMERATRKTISPRERFEMELHPWSAFVIMPLFALANTGIEVHAADIFDSVSVAVICGLVLGKPIGIISVSWLMAATRVATLPRGVGWGAIAGGGFLAGIGFTMSIFIAGLALDASTLEIAKVGIIGASVISATIGTGLLVIFCPAGKSAGKAVGAYGSGENGNE